MGMMVFLKIAAEITLLAMVGAPIAVHYGAFSLQLILFIAASALAETLSFMVYSRTDGERSNGAADGQPGRSRGLLRILQLLPFIIPVAVYFLMGITIPSAVLCGIILAYAVYIAASGKYFPDSDQQKLIFKITLGVMTGMVIILLFAQGRDVSFSWSIFSGIISVVCSVLIMRSLRHEPATYGRMSFQLMNVAVVAGLSAAVFALTRRPVLKGIGTVLRTVYNGIAYVVLTVVFAVIRGIAFLLRWLKQLFGAPNIQPPQQPVQEMQIQETEDLFPDVTEITGAPQWLRIILIVIAILAAAGLLVLIFRFISGRRAQARYFKEETESCVGHPEAIRKSTLRHESSDVKGVRKQYRKYLMYLKNNGVGLTDDLTTQEIGKLVPAELGGTAAEELRELYIEARYNGNTDRAGEERAKELVKLIKSKGRN